MYLPISVSDEDTCLLSFTLVPSADTEMGEYKGTAGPFSKSVSE